MLSGGGGFLRRRSRPRSYGTDSFYQPLFLYWDWIVANNPYRYVTAAAGNRNWEDATTWVTTLDPAYQILAGGQLVNGLPTELGGGPGTGTPQFGEVCVQQPAVRRQRVPEPRHRRGAQQCSEQPERRGPAQRRWERDRRSAAGECGADRLCDRRFAGFGLDQVDASPNAAPGYRDGPLPAATLANGLPGATNFVANNSNGVRTTGVVGALL